MFSQRFRMVLLGGLCSSVCWGCAESKWPLDAAVLRHDPTADVLQLPNETDPAPSKTPPPSAAEAGATTKASGEPRQGTLESELALARLCERRGEDERAERLYRAALRKAPKDPRPHQRLGVMAVQKRDYARAQEHFRAARSLAPPSADLLSDIGYCYYLQEQLKEAENVLGQALQAEPNHVAATNNLALVVGAQGRFDEALALFKRVNSEAKAYANLAYVLAQHGDLTRSEEMYLCALTLDNKMRAAAQAVLQVAERRRTGANLASAGGKPPSSAQSSNAQALSELDAEPSEVSPPPEAADPGGQTSGSRTVGASHAGPASN
jgi:tetratricopeptide (TPR) repeat protein